MRGLVLGAVLVALWLDPGRASATDPGALGPEAISAPSPDPYATRGVTRGRSAARSSVGRALFPLGRGWLGGDAAYSIPLDDNRILWMFGDTFTDVNREGVRRWVDLVGNSVGVSQYGAMGWSTSFYYGRSADGDALPFFNSPEPKTRYWPRDGFIDGETVFVFLTKALYTGVGPFGFDVIGSTLASFDAREVGFDTLVRYDDLPIASDFLVGAAVASSGGDILIYSPSNDSRGSGAHPVYLNRYSGGQFQYLAADRAGRTLWENGLHGDDALEVVDNAASEFSVHFHQATRQWVMVYSDPDVSSGKIWLRTARQPEGPWSDQILLYTIPQFADSIHVPFAFTYAA
ncbi:MAG TPA: DUF4185 domain-containing protein, partial [Candidatus Bathyarchaeia archaeon]|nr:DUF4185 domain-containing protein [Candidatus Bathyarchaeia archaeon]